MRQYSKDMDYNEAVLLTQELVRIPSHKDVEDRESKVAEFIYAYCKEKGLEVEYQVVEGKRRNVIARLRGNGTGKTLMLSGHIDTVPPYDMVYDDPYSGDIVDGHLLGRGCNDMKGAVACMITAMVNIKNKGKVLGGDIILAAVAGEEEKSDGTALVVKSGITADGAIEGEPSNYGYSLGHRGLEWIEIKFIGKRAHGATPELGINAISKASKFIQKVETDLMPKLKERKNEKLSGAMNWVRTTPRPPLVPANRARPRVALAACVLLMANPLLFSSAHRNRAGHVRHTAWPTTRPVGAAEVPGRGPSPSPTPSAGLRPPLLGQALRQRGRRPAVGFAGGAQRQGVHVEQGPGPFGGAQ